MDNLADILLIPYNPNKVTLEKSYQVNNLNYAENKDEIYTIALQRLTRFKTLDNVVSEFVMQSKSSIVFIPEDIIPDFFNQRVEFEKCQVLNEKLNNTTHIKTNISDVYDANKLNGNSAQILPLLEELLSKINGFSSNCLSGFPVILTFMQNAFISKGGNDDIRNQYLQLKPIKSSVNEEIISKTDLNNTDHAYLERIKVIEKSLKEIIEDLKHVKHDNAQDINEIKERIANLSSTNSLNKQTVKTLDTLNNQVNRNNKMLEAIKTDTKRLDKVTTDIAKSLETPNQSIKKNIFKSISKAAFVLLILSLLVTVFFFRDNLLFQLSRFQPLQEVKDNVAYIENSGVFIDERDNQSYSWIRVGSQVWMIDNLKYLPSVQTVENGSFDEPQYYIYGNEQNSIIEAKKSQVFVDYGVLYNYPAAQTACPKGWRLPSNQDFELLLEYINRSLSIGRRVDSRIWAGFEKFLKSDKHWETNEGWNMCFRGVPNGYYSYQKDYVGLGNLMSFWSVDQKNDEYSWVWWLNSKDNYFKNQEFPKSYGFAVRCIKE